MTSGIVTALQHADATVSGQVQVSSRFFDNSPATQSVLSQLAQQYAPQGLTLREGGGAELASRLLASAILTKGGPHQPVPGRTDSSANKIITGLVPDPQRPAGRRCHPCCRGHSRQPAVRE